jgi:hypothetical protein
MTETLTTEGFAVLAELRAKADAGDADAQAQLAEIRALLGVDEWQREQAHKQLVSEATEAIARLRADIATRDEMITAERGLLARIQAQIGEYEAANDADRDAIAEWERKVKHATELAKLN